MAMIGGMMAALEGVEDHADKLLLWYDREGRSLPWRYKNSQEGEAAQSVVNPYHVWLSEVMLQQTTVTAVIPYFTRFLKLWPSVETLAQAPLDEVLTQWAGLGYYARARNLHKCAQVITADYQGVFPNEEEELLKLPGIGAYTAAAITAIAFNKRAVVVDGNVERVVSRVFQVEEPLPTSKPTLKGFADDLTPFTRAGDYAQAMMDLGATICKARSPSCLLCPVSEHCAALASGMAAQLPFREKKAPKPRKKGACFYIVTKGGMVLLDKRPDKGLLAKMAQIPTTSWVEEGEADGDFLQDMPFEIAFTPQWRRVNNEVTHVFTHFHLRLAVYVAEIEQKEADSIAVEEISFYWASVEALDKEPLPSLMQKVIKAAQGDE